MRGAQLTQPLGRHLLQSLSDVRVALEHLVEVFHRQREQTAVGVRANARHALRLRQQADFYDAAKSRIEMRHVRICAKTNSHPLKIAYL